MSIQTVQQGAVTVIRPVGPLTGPESQALRSAAQEALRSAGGRFVVDLSGAAFVDSQALEALVEVNDQLRATGSQLKLCGENETVRQTLDLTDLAGLFQHFVDCHAAVRSFLA